MLRTASVGCRCKFSRVRSEAAHPATLRITRTQVRLRPINPWVKAFEVQISLSDPWVKAFEVQISLSDPWVKAFEVRISLFDPWVKAFEVQISLFDPWVKAFEVQINLFDPWVKGFEVQINLFDPQVTRRPARVTMPALPGRSGCTQGTLPNPAAQPPPLGMGIYTTCKQRVSPSPG
ncbi:hypothetical protein [Plasticicumulans sp.]|uniref:hypothetical protein n=1 Tax=Plasticicumulans sp. TaxID=2307179 RepID=UPI0039647615